MTPNQFIMTQRVSSLMSWTRRRKKLHSHHGSSWVHSHIVVLSAVVLRRVILFSCTNRRRWWHNHTSSDTTTTTSVSECMKNRLGQVISVRVGESWRSNEVASCDRASMMIGGEGVSSSVSRLEVVEELDTVHDTENGIALQPLVLRTRWEDR